MQEALKDIESLEGHNESEINGLKEQNNKSYEEQMRQISEMVCTCGFYILVTWHSRSHFSCFL